MNPRAKSIDPVTERIINRILTEAEVAEQAKSEQLTPRMNALGITGLAIFPAFAVACFGSPKIRVQISREYAEWLIHATDKLEYRK